MVVASNHNQESSTSMSLSNSGTTSTMPTTTTTSTRRNRTLNSTTNNNGGGSNNNSNNQSNNYSSDLNSSDSDQDCEAVRVGDEFQAEIPDFCLPKPAARDYPEKAEMVWTPYNQIAEEELDDYIRLAKEKYSYNMEQSLGILFWHEFNTTCALADLPNYAPYPDDWNMEDRALFEQAYQFHNKNFHKINQMLPDKKLSSIVKFYYTWKKVKTRNNSYVDKQVKRSNHCKDELDNDDYDADLESNEIPTANSKEWPRKECSQCFHKNSPQYYNTKFGFLCKTCYGKRKRSLTKSQKDLSRYSQSSKEKTNDSDPSSSNILFDELQLNEIANERLMNTAPKVLENYNHEIEDLKTKIRLLKQDNDQVKSSLKELPDLSLLNQMNNRTISRWTNEEVFLITQAIRDYGKDFKVIADIIGTKTELQIKNYYLQNQEKMEALINEHDDELNENVQNDNVNEQNTQQQS